MDASHLDETMPARSLHERYRQNESEYTNLSDVDLDNATPSEIANMVDPEPAQQDQDLASDDDAEITTAELLAEARAEGVWQDPFSEDPLKSACMPTPPASAAGDLDDWPGLTNKQRDAATDLVGNGEKWIVDKESAGFLASVIAFGKDDRKPLSFEDGAVRFADLKVEEPILHCDPDLDLQKLRARNTVKLSTRGLLPFMLDESQGEGIAWSQANLLLPQQKREEVAAERLEIDKDVMKFLRKIAEPSLVSDAEMARCFIEADKVCRIRRAEGCLLTCPSRRCCGRRRHHFCHCRHPSARRLHQLP